MVVEDVVVEDVLDEDDDVEVEEVVVVGGAGVKGWQIAPRSEISLNVSEDEPLDTPYFAPATVPSV